MKIFSEEEWDDEELEALEESLRTPLRNAVKSFPSQEESSALIHKLQVEFDMLRADLGTEDTPKLAFNNQVKPPSITQLLLNQFRLNRKYLLSACTIIFIMLIFLVDPADPEAFLGSSRLTNLFAFIIPLLIILSMLFSFRSWDRGMRALENITPYPPVLVIYCRMLIVIGLILGWATVSSVIATIRVSAINKMELPVWPFILQWLGISLIIGGISMVVMFYKGSKYALGVSSVIYILWIFMTSQSDLYSYRITSWLEAIGLNMSEDMFINYILLGLGVTLIILTILKSFSYTENKNFRKNSVVS